MVNISCYNFSVRGKSHIEKSQPCQDYSLVSEISPGLYLGVVCDGVGSCRHSEAASEIIAKKISGFWSENIPHNTGDDMLMKASMKLAFSVALKELMYYAAENSIPESELHTTVDAAVYDGNHILVYGHVGDSGITAMLEDGQFADVTVQQKGSVHSATNSVFQVEHWEFGVCKGEKIVSVIMATDGMLEGGMHYSGDIPYIPVMTFLGDPVVFSANRNMTDEIRKFITMSPDYEPNTFYKIYSTAIKEKFGNSTEAVKEIISSFTENKTPVKSVDSITDDKTVLGMVNLSARPDKLTVDDYKDVNPGLSSGNPKREIKRDAAVQKNETVKKPPSDNHSSASSGKNFFSRASEAYKSTAFRVKDGYYGAGGDEYILSQKIIENNECGYTLYSLKGNEYIAKIFNSSSYSKSEEKLKSLINIKNQYPRLDFVLWPQDIIYRNGMICGYTVKNINNYDSLMIMDKIINPRYNLQQMNRVVILINLCLSLLGLHNSNILSGGLNPCDIIVDLKKCNVYLMCDNLIINGVRKSAADCMLEARAGYIAPELIPKISQSNNQRCFINEEWFSKENDCFALAVIIFRFFMNGEFPYERGVFISSSINDSVLRGNYPYTRNKKDIFSTLKNIPNIFWHSYKELPHNLSEKFIISFDAGHSKPEKRPSAKEWSEVLGVLHGELKNQ